MSGLAKGPGFQSTASDSPVGISLVVFVFVYSLKNWALRFFSRFKLEKKTVSPNNFAVNLIVKSVD